MPTRDVTTENFQSEVLNADKPVVVDFWAEWCGPCRMVAPVLNQISDEHADKIDIVKLNVDHHPQLAAQYQITSIPALKVFKNGEVVKSIIGAKPKAALESDLADYIA